MAMVKLISKRNVTYICPMRSRIGPVIGVKMSAIADRVEAAVGLASRCAV